MTGLRSRRSADSAEDQTQCNARTSALIRRKAPLVAVVVGFRDDDWLERALTGTARGRISIKHSSYKFSKGREASVAGRQLQKKNKTTTTRKNDSKNERRRASSSVAMLNTRKLAEKLFPPVRVGAGNSENCSEKIKNIAKNKQTKKKEHCMFYFLILC